MVILTKGLEAGDRHAGVGAQEVVNGWEIFEVRRPAFQDEIQRDSSEPLALSNAELAALPPVAALIEAAGALLDAWDGYEMTAALNIREAEEARAALAQFEPEE
jgi:hypothetical protein